MVLLADIGGITGAINQLSTLKLPPDVIKDIVAILESSPDELAPKEFQPVNNAWFGSAWSSQNLGIHTDKAHQKLQNSLIEAVAAISSTSGAMQQFDDDIHEKDADAAAVSQALVARTGDGLNQMDGDRSTAPVPIPVTTDEGDQ